MKAKAKGNAGSSSGKLEERSSALTKPQRDGVIAASVLIPLLILPVAIVNGLRSLGVPAPFSDSIKQIERSLGIRR